MSLKLNKFYLNCPAPQTADKFLVMLPGLMQSSFRVSAASLPHPEYTEGVVWYLGRPFYLPNGRNSAGEWTCTYCEDIAEKASIAISALERRINQMAVYLGTVRIWMVEPFLGRIPINEVLLKYAWLKKVDPVPLDWSDPTSAVKYKLTFRYSSILRAL